MKPALGTPIEDVRRDLQLAIELEHATIPPYMTALYSIKRGTNPQITGLVLSVMREEMLHMALACNMLNAVGGQPAINQPGFVPSYPTRLPGCVRPDLVVGIEPFSIDLVDRTFMSIESPEDPLDPRILLHTSLEVEHTIGDFYRGIATKLQALGESAFTGDPALQISEDGIFPVRGLADALRAIEEIVEQGEGASPLDPQDEEHELAHYYRFQEIVRGRTLQKSASGEWVYGPPEIPFDPSGVWSLMPNMKRADTPDGSEVRERLDTFNGAYWRVLNALHETFNGQPQRFKAAVGTMFELKVLAGRLMETPLGPGHPGLNGTPSFEYVAPRDI